MTLLLWAPVIVIVLLFLLTVFRGAPYVPTRSKDLRRAFGELYPLTSKDLVVDIGSGDGVVLRCAADRGARAVGFEVNPILVVISRWLSRRYRERVEVKLTDFWYAKLPEQTTLVYAFGESRDINRMYHRVEQEVNRLGKVVYFMSYGFEVKNKQSIRSDKSFYLYKLVPLLREEPQV